MTYPPSMDQECIAICDALNSLPGINTFESCCGHNERPHRIFFQAMTIEALVPIIRCTHSSAWHVEVRHVNIIDWENDGAVIDGVSFMLEGPVGPENIPGGAADFAGWLTDIKWKKGLTKDK